MTPVPLGDHDETGGCRPQYDTGSFLLKDHTTVCIGKAESCNGEPTGLTAEI